MLRRDPLDLIAIVVPGLVAVVLCAIGLSARSLWLDEGATVAIASQHGAALWQGIAHDGGNMLLYYLAMHVWMAIAGHGEVALRLPSLIADGLTAAFTAALGVRLLGSRVAGAAAGLLCGVSISLVFWGQDARGYAPMVAAATAALLALAVLLDAPADRPPPPAVLVGYVVANTAALYIGFDVVLLVPAQLLTAWLVQRHLRALLGSLIVVAALCVPLVVLAMDRGSDQLFWVPGLSFSGLWQAALALVSAGLAPNFSVTALSVVLAVLSLLALGAAAVLALLAHERRGDRPLILAPAIWVLATALVALLGAAAGEPLELSRIAVLMVPGVALALGWMVWCSGLPRPWTLAALVLVLVLRTAVLVPAYGNSPEPWQRVAAFVLAHSRYRDCIAFYPEDGRMPFSYYVQRTPDANRFAPRPLLPTDNWRRLVPHVESYTLPNRVTMTQWAEQCPRLWLLSSHAGSPTGTRASRSNYRGLLFLVRGLAHRYRAHSTHVFGHAAAIDVRVFRR